MQVNNIKKLIEQQQIDGKFNVSEKACLHDACPKCNGTGRQQNGQICVHMISCPCKKCSPCYL